MQVNSSQNNTQHKTQLKTIATGANIGAVAGASIGAVGTVIARDRFINSVSNTINKNIDNGFKKHQNLIGKFIDFVGDSLNHNFGAKLKLEDIQPVKSKLNEGLSTLVKKLPNFSITKNAIIGLATGAVIGAGVALNIIANKKDN